MELFFPWRAEPGLVVSACVAHTVTRTPAHRPACQSAVWSGGAREAAAGVTPVGFIGKVKAQTGRNWSRPRETLLTCRGAQRPRSRPCGPMCWRKCHGTSTSATRSERASRRPYSRWSPWARCTRLLFSSSKVQLSRFNLCYSLLHPYSLLVLRVKVCFCLFRSQL